MKNLYLIFALFLSFSVLSQAPQADELVKIHSVTTTQMNAILNPTKGSLVYNSTEKATYQRTDNAWIQLGISRRVHVGHFIISATGNQTISGLAFKPYSITFQAYANIETENINDDNDSGSNNSNTIANAFHSMTGYAKDNSGTITQQVIGVGGNGTSINDISRYSNPTQCIGIRYGNQNGDNLGLTTASLTEFRSDGFRINVNNRVDNLLIIYTAYE